MEAMSTKQSQVISPATKIMPVAATVSQATRAMGSWARMASSTPSEIWSQTLSGCPSVTDSEVKMRFNIALFLSRVCILEVGA